MSDLLNLQLFARVVEQGSFSAAARLLGITPSSVSRQVSQMEAMLGARLFNRTTRRLSLTEAGEIYFHRTHHIVADIEVAQMAVRRLADTPSGSLHVTVEADFALAYIAPLLPDFLSRYPDVQLRLSMSAGEMDLIDSGIDLAIRIGYLNDSSLISRKIAVSRSIICASPEYLAKHGAPSHPSELAAHSCLSFRTRPGKNYWRFQLPKNVLDVPISSRLNANSLVFLRDSAVAGLGIIMIPTWMISEQLKQQRLTPLLEGFTLAPPSTPINIVFAHNRYLAPKVRAFIDFLTERMKSL